MVGMAGPTIELVRAAIAVPSTMAVRTGRRRGGPAASTWSVISHTLPDRGTQDTARAPVVHHTDIYY
ncbi:hypothetical protein GCM10027590_41370 [Nocardiopsis nanhaiensis]